MKRTAAAAMQWTMPPSKAPSFEMVALAGAAEQAPVAPGGAPAASAGRAPRISLAVTAGWAPAPVARAPRAVGGPEK